MTLPKCVLPLYNLVRFIGLLLLSSSCIGFLHVTTQIVHCCIMPYCLQFPETIFKQGRDFITANLPQDRRTLFSKIMTIYP